MGNESDLTEMPEDFFQVNCDECGAPYLTQEADISPGERSKRQCQYCWLYELVYGETRE